MTVISALSLAGGLFLVALAVGVAMGSRLAPRALGRRQRWPSKPPGSRSHKCWSALMVPLGTAVVDRHRDVVYPTAGPRKRPGARAAA